VYGGGSGTSDFSGDSACGRGDGDQYGRLQQRQRFRRQGRRQYRAAIKAAFEAYAQKPHKPVFFPPGTYLISETITFYDGIVRGVNASIRQKDPEKDVFHITHSWRTTIEGITFHGGRTHINAPHNNTDQGISLINDCRFYKSGDFAIRMEVTSSIVTISNCLFSDCEQAFVCRPDWTTFKDSWISSSKQMKNKAVIENRSAMLLCENIVGVPRVNGQDQRWIDNYGSLTCRNFRFGGESGGFTPVVHWIKGRDVLLDDCCMWANGNNKRLCAVYCEEMPHQLVITNCILGNPPIRVRPDLDIRESLKHVGKGAFTIRIADNDNPYIDDAETKRIIKEAAKRDTSPAPIPGQLSKEETEAALAKAAGIVAALPAEEPAAMESKIPQRQFGFKPHTQKTDPADHIEFPFVKRDWDLGTYMDSTVEKNSRYLAVEGVGDDVVVLRRSPSMWAHVAIRNITMNLDEYPVLSWKLKDPNNGRPAHYAVKVIDDQSKELRMLYQQPYVPFFEYCAVDLREAFGFEGGTHTFTIHFYPLIHGYMEGGHVETKAGDFVVIDFIRAERE
jgi:hypothetical protein